MASDQTIDTTPMESRHGQFLKKTASFLASHKRLIQFAGLLALLFSAAYFYWQYETKLQVLTAEKIEDAKMLMIFIQNETTRIMGSGMFLNLEGAFKKINDTAYKKGVIVNIYRPDGREAFSDMRTVENVLSVALEQKDYEVKDIANIPVSEIISHAQEVLKRDRPKISKSLFDGPEGAHAKEHFDEALIKGESEDTSHPSIIEEFAKIDREECGDVCHMGQNAVIRLVIDKKEIEKTLASELEWDMAKVSAFVGGLLLLVWLYVKLDEINRQEREQEREKHFNELANANNKLLNLTSELSLKNELFKLVNEITVAANEASTIKDVMLICLSKTCKHTGWPIGHAYKLVNKPDGTAVLKPTDLWHINSPKQFRAFQTVTKVTDFKYGDGLPGLVLKSRKPEWIIDVTESLNFPRLEKAKLMNEDIDVKGAFAFPVFEGETITYILEFFSEKPEELNELLLSVVAGLAIQIGRVTERKQAEEALKKANNSLNASLEELEVKNRLLEDDLHIAHKMQLSIVPQMEKVESLSRSFSLEIASVYNPCSKLGGDFWDIMELSENKIGIVVVDFAGHGIAPSLNTFRIKEFMYSSANETTSPSMLIEKMNKNIFNNFNMHGTCFYAVYDKQDKKLTYGRAGHPYALWYQKSEDKLVELNSKGVALGIFPDSKYEEGVITFEPGDKVIFYTDGIIEAMSKDNDIFGEGRLQDIILQHKDKSSSAISAAIMESFTDFTGEAELNDDITLVTLGQKKSHRPPAKPEA